MKVQVNYSTTSYGCQKNNEGVMSDWMSAGSETQIVEFTPNPNYSITVQAIKSLKQPFQFGNSHTVMHSFKVTVIDDNE